jgi:hypothetical protein
MVMKKWQEENMTIGFIQPSWSRNSAPCLLVKLWAGRLWLCIEYWDIYCTTVQNRYTRALIPETVNILLEAWIDTNLEVCMAYILIPVKEGDNNKFLFWAMDGLFESLVMHIRTMNWTADFQSFINDMIQEDKHSCTSDYLDDITTYSNVVENHERGVNWVMKCLLKKRLCLKLERCELHQHRVKYIWVGISSGGILID